MKTIFKQLYLFVLMTVVMSGCGSSANSAESQSTTFRSYRYTATASQSSGVFASSITVGTSLSGYFSYDLKFNPTNLPPQKSSDTTIGNTKLYYSDIMTTNVTIRTKIQTDAPYLPYYHITVINDNSGSAPLGDSITFYSTDIDYAKSIGADEVDFKIQLVDSTGKVFNDTLFPEILSIDSFYKTIITATAIKNGVTIGSLSADITSLSIDGH